MTRLSFFSVQTYILIVIDDGNVVSNSGVSVHLVSVDGHHSFCVVIMDSFNIL